MPAAVHAAAILWYGPMAGYVLLAVVAGLFAVLRRSLPGWFWVFSLAALVLVAVQAVAGVVLFLGGARPDRSLHVLYGLLALAGGLIQHALRPGGRVRRAFVREVAWGEARTLALVSLTQAALLMRAWMTGLGAR
ncbi:MAG: hypothetical protein QN178_17400 [Armatimonadota bacterium]|nr:hypothetical protein [Armatimonadota bacterium]